MLFYRRGGPEASLNWKLSAFGKGLAICLLVVVPAAILLQSAGIQYIALVTTLMAFVYCLANAFWYCHMRLEAQAQNIPGPDSVVAQNPTNQPTSRSDDVNDCALFPPAFSPSRDYALQLPSDVHLSPPYDYLPRSVTPPPSYEEAIRTSSPYHPLEGQIVKQDQV